MRKYTLVFSIIIMMLLNLVGCSSKQAGSSKGLKLQSESEHFKFYCDDKDTKALRDLKKYLELAYPKITSDFKVKFDKKIDVKIYPDSTTFRNDSEVTDAPDWLVGTAAFGDIRIISPLNPPKEMEYLEIIAISIHEFTHLVSQRILTTETRGIFWISDGISVYEAKQIPGNKAKQKIYDEAVNNNLPKINQLEYADYKIDNQYDYAYSMVEYVVQKYGIDKLNGFIREKYLDNDFMNTFGVSKDKFELGWHDFILHNYKIK